MTFIAEQHSAFFRRSIEAWRRRSPELDIAGWLQAIVDRPVDPQALDHWYRRLFEAARGSDEAARTGQALRRTRSLAMMAIIERDLRGAASLEEVCEAMTALAELATGRAMRTAAAELAQRHGTPLDEAGQPQDLLTVAMGKGGGCELNVSSDLDVVFVFREEGETAGAPDEQGRPTERGRIATSEFMHRLARRTVSLLAESTEDGFVFRVDTRLRPFGDSGPLVVSLSMLENYFFSQGREWERFAWLKGRVIGDSGLAGDAARAGDERLLQAIVVPFVFRRYLDFKAFAAMRDLHAMIRAEVGKLDARRNGSYDVKLGAGGIREIEFTAQLFQIVRGGRDPGLRDRRTLTTLQTLAARKLLDADDVSALTDAYRFLRRTEHALQYIEDAQTHRLPADPAQRAAVAAMLALDAATFEAALERHTTRVDRIFGDLLHGESDDPEDPSLPRAAPHGDVRNGSRPGNGGRTGNGTRSPNGNGHRRPGGTTATGQGEPAADISQLPDDARRRIEAMRDNPRYRAARAETRQAIDQVLTAAIQQGAAGAALDRLIDLLTAVSGRGAYVALLAQYPQALSRVLRMVSQAKWAADYLTRHPILLDELLDGQLLEPVDYGQWMQQVQAQLALAELPGGQPDVERQMDIVREAHHAQVFRLLAQDLEGRHTVEHLSDLLSELADRVLAVAIELLWSQSPQRFREAPKFAAIAYGKLGSKELGYASDLDLVFLYDDDDERAPEAYAHLARKLGGWLSTRTAAGLLFDIDLRLRPNGNAGLLVSTLKSFTEYQLQSAWVWEHQALTRARFAAGDADVGRRFEQARRAILVLPRDPAKLREEVIGMRRKMHDGHPNRSKLFDLKHDAGGMVDIEFIVQYLVLWQGPRLPQLLDDAGNIALLGRAAAASLIPQSSADAVADAYRRYRQMQHLLRLNDQQYARVEPDTVAAERSAVVALWKELLG
ncbi:MAG TPA: bifunctional [glutamate--ammonia ligase]-adenylyl-L-tyrosine phosphorylase/[glutamate--ammonia-ligase] adenylyltransferase [Burkholderiaceae bacterium]|nr:bifunctional [glutamate--ammonia ligase]-adenylyl-L-tyrosine phosphorylase/[glutamate--ammonia-ligase] adenylyltransferase [Burkholderiaceae bacterium]